MKNKIRFKRISNRHKQAIYFLFGIALGFGLIFFFVKDKFSTLEANESKNITIKEQTISQFPVRDSVYLDLNASDTLDLQEVRGVGKVRARNIYKYGQKLGGYISVNQLKEVYSIDSATFEQIKPHFYAGKTEIRKVNINSDDPKYLARHPYIDFALAKALIRFRKKYEKDFNSIEEIKQIHLMDEETYNKLRPYIKLSE
ncbi:MAG: helix-hairpin-helix domain-containing protein [Bacteroidales bacterium]|jgi:DNA uptake protein ComE-like DNA-binding protein|nr:helix-hairpin-helix domain-containing protein [Bacteroidales bacterium]MBQ5891214.1 helix-hairpin-helix domain-containing protein [Bacteroidales bacterium]MBR5253878.1 helix-hairpin-helix domain-containing protein [Bacteroidales bacterium]MEE1271475.1 helix-hairpin-helix domain-containing protein [Bacteroidales bacterium]